MLGGAQPLLDGGGKAALEHYRFVGLADSMQQVVVLHIAGADLEHIGLRQQLHLPGVHYLGDNG